MNIPVAEVEAIPRAKAQRKGAEVGVSAIATKRAGTEVEVEGVRNAATAAVAAVGGNDQEEVEMAIVIIHGNDGDDLTPLNQIILQFLLPVKMRRPPRRLLMSQP